MDVAMCLAWCKEQIDGCSVVFETFQGEYEATSSPCPPTFQSREFADISKHVQILQMY